MPHTTLNSTLHPRKVLAPAGVAQLKIRAAYPCRSNPNPNPEPNPSPYPSSNPSPNPSPNPNPNQAYPYRAHWDEAHM
eukprot:scaffold125302_cov33-Phaeocystis_antarctica.AAC.1